MWKNNEVELIKKAIPKEGKTVFYPQTTQEVQLILKEANKAPISTISWETQEDEKQMGTFTSDYMIVLSELDKIIEVNEESRYVVVQAGVTCEQLENYLMDNYPALLFPMIPSAMGKTIASTVLKDAVHNYCTLYGTLSEMISGLEVVLPDGQVILVGSKSLGQSWFNIGPLPDLKGIFVNWNGIYGIVTKVALRLLPKVANKDTILFMIKNHDLLDEAIEKVIHLELADYIHVVSRDKPNFLNRDPFIVVHFSGVLEQELLYKSKKICQLFEPSKEIVVRSNLPSNIKTFFHLKTMMSTEFTEEIHAILPTHNISKTIKQLKNIFAEEKVTCCLDFSLVDHGHKTILRIGWNHKEDKSDGTLLNKINMGLTNLSCIIWGNPYLVEEQDGLQNPLLAQIGDIMDPNHIMGVSNY